MWVWAWMWVPLSAWSQAWRLDSRSMCQSAKGSPGRLPGLTSTALPWPLPMDPLPEASLLMESHLGSWSDLVSRSRLGRASPKSEATLSPEPDEDAPFE